MEIKQHQGLKMHTPNWCSSRRHWGSQRYEPHSYFEEQTAREALSRYNVLENYVVEWALPLLCTALMTVVDARSFCLISAFAALAVSWLWTEEVQCYQLPRSCYSAGSQIPLMTFYSSQTHREFLVLWGLWKDELFQNVFGCWVLGCGVLEPACTGSSEPVVHMSRRVGVLSVTSSW